MNYVTNLIRKIIVALIGIPILIIGIILIPLPGPGIIICILGLFILSIEFKSVDAFLQNALAQIKKIVDKSYKSYKKRIEEIDKK